MSVERECGRNGGGSVSCVRMFTARWCAVFASCVREAYEPAKAHARHYTGGDAENELLSAEEMIRRL